MSAARRRNLAATASVAACGLLILAIALVSSNPTGDALQRRASTFFTDDTGARAIYLVLDELLPDVGQWRRPFTDLQFAPGLERATLVVMQPSVPMSPSEAVALDDWLGSGGQLVLAASEGWSVRRQSDPDESGTPESYLARHGLEGVATDRAAAPAQSARVVEVGSGRIVLVPDGHAFSNDALRAGDGAVWLVEQAAAWPGPVLFDEYHQGFGLKRGLLALTASFLASPWGLVCFQVALAGAVYLLGTRRRFGRPIDEPSVDRTDPAEAVDALGGLFETARARGLSARAIHQHLNAELSARLGYRVDLSRADSRARLASLTGLDRGALDAFADGVRELVEGPAPTDAALVHVARQATAICRET